MGNALIHLADGTYKSVDAKDIEALINAGMLEVAECDNNGNPAKLRLTQAAFDFVNEDATEEGGRKCKNE